MDVEARNKYCGYIMFNTASSKGTGSKSNDLINYDASSFSNYDSDLFPQTGPTNHSMAAGAAAVEDQTVKKEENPFQIYDPSNNNNGVENGKKLPGSSKMQPEKRPPRPPNAFILYRRAKQPAILAAHRNLTNAEISRYISTCWKSETDEERLSWERYADQKKLEHMQAYPNYVYRPNKNKGKNEKRRQARKQSAAATFNSQESTMNSTYVDESGPIRATKKNKGQNRLNNLVGRIEIPIANKVPTTGIQNINFSMMTPPLSSPNTPNNSSNLVYTSAPVPFSEPEQLQNTSFSTQDMQQMQMYFRMQQHQQQEVLFQNNLTNLSFQSINELTPGSFREETVDPLIFAFPNHDDLIYSSQSSFDSISTNNSDLNLNSQKINTSCAFPEFRDNTQGLADIFAGIQSFESTFEY